MVDEERVPHSDEDVGEARERRACGGVLVPGGRSGRRRSRLDVRWRVATVDVEQKTIYVTPARSLFAEGRDSFVRLTLHDEQVVARGRDLLFFPWKGDWVMNTLALQLSAAGLHVGREGIALQVAGLTANEFRERAGELAKGGPADPLDLVARARGQASEKHHRFLSDPLLTADYASRMLDVEGAWEALDRLGS